MKNSSFVLHIFSLIAAGGLAAQPTNLDFQINERAFSLPLTTPISVDGEIRTVADLPYLRDGLHVVWDETAVRALPLLIFSYSLIGPVTAVNPLTVLGQPLTLTTDTVRGGFTDETLLPIGTHLVIAAMVDANGSMLATLVERRTGPGNRFLLTGFVQELSPTPGLIRVGEQWVDTAGLAWQSCPGGQPVVGDHVDLSAVAVASFPPGSVLQSVTDGRCVMPVPAGTVGAAGFLQGLVSTLPAADQFTIGGLAVTHTATTQFQFGTVDDLDAGVAVVVDGAYTGATSLTADVVEFFRPVVRFEAPVAPAAVIAGQQISLMGVPVRWSAQVRDEDGILGNGLLQPRQVEVRGYLDRAGVAWATRVRDRGNPDGNSVRLRGPVQVIGSSTFQIQGLLVDTIGALFFDDLLNPITSTQFFASVLINDLVDVSGSVYDAANGTLTGGDIVLIGAEPFVVNRSASGGAAAATIRAGTASGYALPDPVFKNSFE